MVQKLRNIIPVGTLVVSIILAYVFDYFFPVVKIIPAYFNRLGWIFIAGGLGIAIFSLITLLSKTELSFTKVRWKMKVNTERKRSGKLHRSPAIQYTLAMGTSSSSLLVPTSSGLVFEEKKIDGNIRGVVLSI